MKGYPKLTEHGAWRGREGQQYGGFYSQDEVFFSSSFLFVCLSQMHSAHSLTPLSLFQDLSSIT